jgi:hypothetical protein
MSIFNQLAPTPPLGWNSWDCFGTSVREDEVKANADYMAAHLARYGWQYIVVDIQWYEPNAQAGGYRPNAELVMDDYGRLMPATNRFPSAANGAGFNPLADYVHSKGLKFGIHILRGIPRQAVRLNLPIMSTSFHAQDIADLTKNSPWIDDMYGIDTSKPGAAAYYESIVALYASWGVDYIKADDILWPYHQNEIELLSRAVQNADRAMVLSLSPGVELSVDHADHLQQHAELWRISADFWDRWVDLKAQFDLCKHWESYIRSNAWPDADMLPLGHIGIRAERGIDRQSLLTPDEQITLMTLWAMFRSPLMFGGDLPSSDPFTLGLLTNEAVLRINQASQHNHELLRQGDYIVWVADDSTSSDKYLAIFNIGEDEMASIAIDWLLLDDRPSGDTAYEIHDLWDQTEPVIVKNRFQQQVKPHGAKLYRMRAI